MEEDNFNMDWLNERYPYDAEARNKSVEASALTYLKDNKNTLKLVDLGAGTGSNALYLMDKLKQNQEWIFVEQDRSLNAILLRRLKDFATYHKYEWVELGDKCEIYAPSKKLSFQIINGSLLTLDSLLALETVDMFLANAVFDLFSKEQVDQLLTIILSYDKACLFTMNYQSMEFSPEDPFDYAFVSLYETHMERLQSFGKAMGKNAGGLLVQFFENINWEITKGDGFWNILEEDIKMHYYLLNFMETALKEIDFDLKLKLQFPQWIQRKKDLIITRRQQLQVGHLDLFVKNEK